MGKKRDSDSDSDADFMDLDSDDEKPKAKSSAAKAAATKGKTAIQGTKNPAGSKGKGKPRAKGADEPKLFTAKTPEDIANEEEGKRIKKYARGIGVIASEREDEEYSAVSKLKPSALVKKFSQAKPQEIHKKSTHRKNKVLFKFPGLLDLVQEGTFGTLSNMHTNPVLDVEFPEGKLRFEGTHIHTRQKFISINPKGKHKTMVAQDVFDHMVVFAKHSWIGKDEKEPSGRDIPDSVYTVKHKGVQYAAGAAGSRDKAGGEDSAQSTLDSWRVPPDEQASQGDGLDGRARRAAATKKVKYTDGDSDFDSGNGSDDAEVSDGEPEGTRSPVCLLPAGVEVVLKGPAKPRSTPNKSTAGATKQSNISSFFTKSGKERAINLDSDDDDNNDAEPSVPQRDKTPKRQSAKNPIKSYKIDSSSEGEGSASGSESDQDKPKPKKKPAPKKSPAEKKASAKRKKESDDEDEDDGDDSDVVIVKKSSAKKAAPRKNAAKKKGSDDDDDDDTDDDEDFGSSKKKKPASAKKAPSAKKASAGKPTSAKKAPPKKKAKRKSSDDESSSSPADDDDDDDWA